MRNCYNYKAYSCYTSTWYSQNENRDGEEDIAIDLLNSGLEVALGGGDRKKDGKDLYSNFRERGYQVVKSRSELLKVQTEVSTPVLGVFSTSHMSYVVDRINDRTLGEVNPTLPEMAACTLHILSIASKDLFFKLKPEGLTAQMI